MKASTKMQKGFTLIELMVVIVIIGILSAVALPKMFGMSAKAKAAEIPQALATFEKMQMAYVAEVSAVGSILSIGFTSPTSKVASYVTSTNGEMTGGLTTASGDCGGAATDWKTVVNNAGDRTRTFGDGDCAVLTPNWLD